MLNVDPTDFWLPQSDHVQPYRCTRKETTALARLNLLLSRDPMKKSVVATASFLRFPWEISTWLIALLVISTVF